MNVAILGAGNIANAMAEALVGLNGEVCAYAVASRDLGKAQDFAKKWGFIKAYGSYEELVNDEAVDLVYIATPHSHHFEHAKLCLNHGKPALVEKAFTGNLKQAKELIALSEEKKVFITEAIWTRYMPAKDIVWNLINSGAIGEMESLYAEFSQPLTHIKRLCDPALAGGALLDLGMYALTFASMYFGNDIVKIETTCDKYETGVDGTDEIHFTYRDGKMAHLRSSFTTIAKNQGMIYGTKGSIYVETLNNYSVIKLLDKDGKLVKECEIPEQINGYEYEVLASLKAIKEGKLQCEEMTHQETLTIMEQMDELRGIWGVVYPFD